ncbi:MBL fold metallo-hydrolase [Enterobacteriaceae endosymbiont of Neohaemonia nigricornis]|uniref:MBL fold metallo-hydrolase n=1 Tax=Enterobacteriaceae endosymbiont of Neohaemonia nigricornis TaxID=2675792 RepID=UPI0014497380|nr:MBL fold metallo-hydrolase [Enterobacteriaceae endosymbiont of Neohaemonia nigricornis]QJC30480.1 MBL fold metallo-hydrolase [Enterobacteriaceae endosymbiont of Neohaemonia nigricornis]
MKYIVIPVTFFQTNCYILWCTKTLYTAIIDPGGDIYKIINIINKYNLYIKLILITHGHLDHIGAAYNLSIKYNIPICGPHKYDIVWIKNIKLQTIYFSLYNCIFKYNQWLSHKQKISLGNILINIYHCPGHTPGHLIFYIKEHHVLISGDIIFKNSIGRTDLPFSNYTHLMKSIKNSILTLNQNTIILPGHGQNTTLLKEIKYNKFISKII